MTPRLRSLLRIVAAFLFIAHGTQKLLGFPGGTPPVTYLSLSGLAGVIESVGGTFILLGLFTRPVALIASGEMAVAYFLVHLRQGFWPLMNHGELALLYCFVFLYIAVAGPGPWSLDRVRRDRAEVRTTGARRFK